MGESSKVSLLYSTFGAYTNGHIYGYHIGKVFAKEGRGKKGPALVFTLCFKYVENMWSEKFPFVVAPCMVPVGVGYELAYYKDRTGQGPAPTLLVSFIFSKNRVRNLSFVRTRCTVPLLKFRWIRPHGRVWNPPLHWGKPPTFNCLSRILP